ncbi:MAG: hypothetical protein V7K25_30550 [Nostoc sp.]|uniref:hypothetical protein n=1 Tax=Nostoc sp. TaxID=1180 RepID=UPI002FF73E17
MWYIRVWAVPPSFYNKPTDTIFPNFLWEMALLYLRQTQPAKIKLVGVELRSP